ncbi:MAG: DUF2341 domain-containing protein, partial [Thermofilum sp.]|uniref:DUF2341 domain-containing protein n=1 Tax=Thermofilum sp. TaxID=1961369 RepID=UPI00258674A2
MNWRKLSVWVILLQLLLGIVALAVPPTSLAPSWYDASVPPGYIALYKSGSKTVSPFYGWVPPGYDYWFLRAVTSSSFPTPISATFTVSSSQDTQIQPYLFDEAFTQTGNGIQAYALPVVLNQGWNLVFLQKSSTPSANGMWAYVTVTDWSQIRFGDSTGSPSNYLPYSIIWSNSTHAQVLVYASQPGTYYLYWQNQIQVPYANVTNPLITCINGMCGVKFNGINNYAMVKPFSVYGWNEYTLVAWISPTNVFGGKTDMIGRNLPSPVWWIGSWIELSPYGTYNVIGCEIWRPSDNAHYVVWDYSMPLSSYKWAQIIYTVSKLSKNVQIYFNSIMLKNVDISSYLDAGYITPMDDEYMTKFVIGTAPTFDEWASLIHGELRIYNRALSPTEISGLYQGTLNPTDGLMLWLVADPHYIYDINWDGYVDWIDLSGNNHHATLYNFHSQGNFIGSVMNVYTYFVAGRQKINVYYMSGSGKTTITWVPFGALVTVKDQNGNTIYSGYGQGTPISLSLSPGTYTVTLSAGGSMLNGLSVQPFYSLSTTVTVSSSSGVAVAPHLYEWYLSGGFLYAQDSQTLDITSTFTLATMVRNIFTTQTSILTKRYYGSSGSSTSSCANYDIYGLFVTSSGLAQAVMTTNSPTTYTVTDNTNLGIQSNSQYVSLVGQYDGSYLKLYRNVTAVFSTNIGSVSLLQCPSMFTVGWSSTGSYVYGYVSYVTLHTVAWSQNSISQMVNSKTLNMTGLVMFVDPTFWDGTKYIDLSGNKNYLYPSGSVSRMEAPEKWLWVLNGKGSPGGITFYYLPVGSMVYISSSTASYWFIATSSNMYVSLPAGTYTVTIYIAGGSAPSSPPQTLVWGDGVFGSGAGLFTATLMPAKSTGTQNWLTGYTYRKEIVIQGSPAGAQTRYPVSIIIYYGYGTDTGNTVYLNGKAKQDFSDVVFTAGDGKTVLPVWIEESLSSVYMVAWVEVPVIPAFPSTTSIYIYYGGQGSPRTSPNQYIEMFDEYPVGASVTTYGSGTAVIYQFGNVKGLLIKQTNSSGALSVVTKWARQGRIIARVYFNSTNNNVGFFEGWSDGTTFSNGRPTQSLLAFIFPYGLQLHNQWSNLMVSKTANIQSNTWYRFEARWYTSYM